MKYFESQHGIEYRRFFTADQKMTKKKWRRRQLSTNIFVETDEKKKTQYCFASTAFQDVAFYEAGILKYNIMKATTIGFCMIWNKFREIQLPSKKHTSSLPVIAGLDLVSSKTKNKPPAEGRARRALLPSLSPLRLIHKPLFLSRTVLPFNSVISWIFGDPSYSP